MVSPSQASDGSGRNGKCLPERTSTFQKPGNILIQQAIAGFLFTDHKRVWNISREYLKEGCRPEIFVGPDVNPGNKILT